MPVEILLAILGTLIAQKAYKHERNAWTPTASVPEVKVAGSGLKVGPVGSTQTDLYDTVARSVIQPQSTSNLS